MRGMWCELLTLQKSSPKSSARGVPPPPLLFRMLHSVGGFKNTPSRCTSITLFMDDFKFSLLSLLRFKLFPFFSELGKGESPLTAPATLTSFTGVEVVLLLLLCAETFPSSFPSCSHLCIKACFVLNLLPGSFSNKWLRNSFAV